MDVSYTLSVDGYPKGLYAAIAVEGKTHALLPIRGIDTPLGPLSERVYEAIRRAEQYTGNEPTIVTVACIDDGSNGTEIARLKTDIGVLEDSKHYILKTSLSSNDAAHSAYRAARSAERFSTIP